MITPARRWRNRILAQQKLRNSELLTSSPQDRRAAECELELDVRRLRESSEQIAQRIEIKRNELLPKWLPRVERYISSGESYRNPELVYCAIWSFDVGDFERGIDYALLAIEQAQPMPDNFSSSMGAFVADTVREWAEREYSHGRSVEPYFSQVFELVTDKWHLHEELTAKWYKLAARLLLRGADGKQAPATAFNNLDTLEQAQGLLLRARDLSDKVGAKTLYEKVTARIKALTRE